MTRPYSPVAHTTSGNFFICEALWRINTRDCKACIFWEGHTQKCPEALTLAGLVT
ncbi:hypothetical protein CIT292_10493 [Citrobacter youngae ATCC 29220]|uniref:Uncharacterized protein n=1 Tax=Citrobacter youngae ATCC 29220 TaxID=500640 RepID=D4BIX6_9ENTR|nr:hypothetical protein CIT292_10493 [Citrobacter youngae ATCC 29220]